MEDLAARIARLEDIESIKQLQARYVHWLFKQEYEAIVTRCFARQHPDVSIEASDSGVFRGPAQVRRFFEEGMASEKASPGFFTMHMAVDPVIEVARDGRTARSVWFSPGATAKKGGKWAWGRFFVDYVKEDGQWRILHSVFAPFFRTAYDKGWWTEPITGSLASLPVEADAPPTVYRPYARDETDQFAGEPPLPEPY